MPNTSAPADQYIVRLLEQLERRLRALETQQTFIVTDVAGRAYTWTYPASGDALNFQELGWLSAPLTFSGTFAGEINWYLGSK